MKSPYKAVCLVVKCVFRLARCYILGQLYAFTNYQTFTCLPLSASGSQQHFVGGLPLHNIDSNRADKASVDIYVYTIIQPDISMVRSEQLRNGTSAQCRLYSCKELCCHIHLSSSCQFAFIYQHTMHIIELNTKVLHCVSEKNVTIYVNFCVNFIRYHPISLLF